MFFSELPSALSSNPEGFVRLLSVKDLYNLVNDVAIENHFSVSEFLKSQLRDRKLANIKKNISTFFTDYELSEEDAPLDDKDFIDICNFLYASKESKKGLDEITALSSVTEDDLKENTIKIVEAIKGLDSIGKSNLYNIVKSADPALAIDLNMHLLNPVVELLDSPDRVEAYIDRYYSSLTLSDLGRIYTGGRRIQLVIDSCGAYIDEHEDKGCPIALSLLVMQGLTTILDSTEKEHNMREYPEAVTTFLEMRERLGAQLHKILKKLGAEGAEFYPGKFEPKSDDLMWVKVEAKEASSIKRPR